MKAIRVKFLPYTETKPTRLKASDDCGNSVTMNYDSLTHLAPIEKRYEAVAIKLCDKMGWSWDIVGGCFKEEYFFVFKVN